MHNLLLLEKIKSSIDSNWEDQEVNLIEEDFDWENYSDAYYKTLNIVLASSFLDDFVSSNHVNEFKELCVYKNQMIFPIVFLFRHYLEVTIKHLIFRFNKFMWIDIKFSTHNLNDLYLDLKNINNDINLNYCKGVITNELVGIDEIIENFNDFDKGSFSFRYPCDKENTPCFQKDFTVNILNLAESLKIAHKTFNKLVIKIESLEQDERNDQVKINEISTYNVVDYAAEDYTKYFGED